MTPPGQLHSQRRTIFIVSTAQRDQLALMVAEAGWRPIAARRTDGADQRYLASDARIAMVDLRGAASLTGMMSALREAVALNGGALIALVDERKLESVPELIVAGATHYICAPVDPRHLAATLASAAAMVDRIDVQSSFTGSEGLNRSDAMFWRFDPEAGELWLSPALAAAFDLPAGKAPSRVMLRQLSPLERQSAIGGMRQALHGGQGAFAHDMSGVGGRRLAHHLHADGGLIIGEVEMLPGGNVRHRADRDFLTGLGNRQAASGWIGARLAAGEDAVVLLFSISQFERINSAYGQSAGDALLNRTARRIGRLVEEMTEGDVLVARMTGTEFLVGLPSGDVDRGVFLARQIMSVIARPFNAGDHMIRLTGRCGIAGAAGASDAQRVLRRASMALAEAREADGEGIRIHGGHEAPGGGDPAQLETDLRLALDRGEIDIVFQPQYRVDTDELVGVEALARWNHPAFGPLGAQTLFSAAGRSDFLLPLSAHIQQRALEIAAGWSGELGRLRLSVNVTAGDIAQPAFLRTFLKLVDGAGFPRERLTVEITESGLIEDIDATSVLLARLRSEGLKVAIDDFGTGYSSLSYLKALPVDYLKIDSGLTRDIAQSDRDGIIVRSIIGMAKSLGLAVIAEGVETPLQLEMLAEEQCDIYQGFLKAPALNSDDLMRFVAAK